MPIADWLSYPPPLYIYIGFGLSRPAIQHLIFLGIQEDNSGKGVLIFSIWDSPTDETKSISSNHHPDAIIKRFGGEGVGMKCQLYKDWNLDETITQKIIGKRVNNTDCDCVTNNNDTVEEKQIWHISSQVL